MIARLAGEVAETGGNYVVLDVSGVGYQLTISERHSASVPPVGTKIEVFCRQVVRENEISLYGFETRGERRLFDLLITVSGLGPRLGISLLSAMNESALVGAIGGKDWKALTRAAGVGSKLAERICIELADKVREESLLGNIGRTSVSAIDDVVEALVSLGHRRGDAERAAQSARDSTDSSDPSSLIPIALQFASKK